MRQRYQISGLQSSCQMGMKTVLPPQFLVPSATLILSINWMLKTHVITSREGMPDAISVDKYQQGENPNPVFHDPVSGQKEIPPSAVQDKYTKVKVLTLKDLVLQYTKRQKAQVT
ncbi:hypothetical protein ACET3Z_002711 [Daucus carota]